MVRRKRRAGCRRIPKQCAKVFDKVRSAAIEAHIRWLTYRALFAVSPKRIELLNASGGVFFHITQAVLLADVQLAICKLTDPPSTGKRENLSIPRLQRLLVESGDKAIARRGARLVKSIERQCKRFRDRRNKTLAHIDLGMALGGTRKRLPGVSRQKIEDALSSIRSYLNAIQEHYCDSETAYASPIVLQGAEALVGVLKAGERYGEHLRAGRFSPTDFRQGEWADA
jgi:hypothetical protein